MPSFDIIREVKPKKSFRVASVMGQFDLQTEHVKENFVGSLDIDNHEWNIGIIYGASGSGKSTIAKQLFGKNYVTSFKYKSDSVLDDMPKEKATEEITKTFNSVGFATVWSWLKPYSVLSTGEKMRVDLARAVLENRELIVFDEFTSVVNREVAKAGSFALQKAIRKLNKKFIAVSCHYDIIDWLEPDWVFNTDRMEFQNTRGLLRRPGIKLQVYETTSSSWKIFRRYHYMNTELNKAARCFIGLIDGEPVCFFAVLHFPHPSAKNFKRGHRLVVLPDYQGLGIGHLFSSYIAEMFVKQGYRFVITSSTKSLYVQRRKDSRWHVTSKTRKRSSKHSKISDSQSKYTFSYEYIGNKGTLVA
jgi:ABC-type dipeptide/oligopeptide/nickel transport system ATPase subunit/GNAT superfamily N-acetyltransferase